MLSGVASCAAVMSQGMPCALATDAQAEAEQKYESAKKELETVREEYEKLSREQNETLQKIGELEKAIQKSRKRIVKLEKELSSLQEKLSGRVRENYKDGGVGDLGLLVSSDSLEDIESNSYYLEKLNERDRELIQSVRESEDEELTAELKLESEKADLEALYEEQSARLEEMKSKQAEVEEMIANLDQDVKDIMAEKDAELLAQAEEAERQRKAQEEAATSGDTWEDVNGGAESSADSSEGSGEAITGSAKSVVDACKSVESPGEGLCAMWVSLVFDEAGFGYYSGNACDMCSSYCTSSDKSQIKPGMIVAVTSHSHTEAGSIYGHIGIYIGDGKLMDNVGEIRTETLDEWIDYYGTTVTPMWGWLGGVELT